MTTNLSPRVMMREEVHELFHEFWQIFTALKTYTQVLEMSRNVVGDDKQVVEELSRMVEALQARAESLRARVLNMIG